jgi:hypothetical protein
MAKITIKQILKLIPKDFLEELERETNINYQVKKMTGKVMFLLLLM